MRITDFKEAEFGESYRLSELKGISICHRECVQNRTWAQVGKGKVTPCSKQALFQKPGRPASDSTAGWIAPAF